MTEMAIIRRITLNTLLKIQNSHLAKNTEKNYLKKKSSRYSMGIMITQRNTANYSIEFTMLLEN